jgi:hypothetical protein
MLKFTDAKILSLSPKEKPYKRFLGEGLYILVRPGGGKYWRLKYYFCGKERVYSMGVFPQVSVTDALKALQKARGLLRDGIDPTDAKRETNKANWEKPVSKNAFRFELSLEGSLTLETDTRLLTLTPSQTKALRTFLLAESAEEPVQ